MTSNFLFASNLKPDKTFFGENRPSKRHSWDTSIKHYFRLGLENQIPKQLKSNIPSSNISRWKQEPENKYVGCGVADFINQEIDLIKRFNQSSRLKKTVEGFFKLTDAFHIILSEVKGIKTIIKNQKALVVNTIESVIGYIPMNQALKVFNISRTTYQNYKSIVIHTCEASYFKWCTKRFPNQLLSKEILTIKNYMENESYKYWSKSSVYLKAVRDHNLFCGLSTFYKYCRLLGFANLKSFPKSNLYNPLKTTKPNEAWCADVTVFKTADGIKHYIHILIDHFSKKVLGYSVEKSNSGKAIRHLLHQAYLKYKPTNTMFLTDGGSENVNTKVELFLNCLNNNIIHRIAQRDVLFSNSMIEAFNKVLKHQFLYPKNIVSRKQLEKVLTEVITLYNEHKPQLNLGGNTPYETFAGTPINLNSYKTEFKTQQLIRIAQNKKNSCKKCC
jgi:putative transposase